MTISTSRRAVLAGAAAAAALAVPALPTAYAGNDPVFAAIEQARQTHDAWLARAIWEDAQPGKLAPAPGDTPEMVALVRKTVDARMALAATVPTTLAGVAAVLRFVAGETVSLSCDQFAENYFDDDETTIFVESLAAAAGRLLQSGAA